MHSMFAIRHIPTGRLYSGEHWAPWQLRRTKLYNNLAGARMGVRSVTRGSRGSDPSELDIVEFTLTQQDATYPSEKE